MIELMKLAFPLMHPAFIFVVLGLGCVAYTPWFKLLNLARNLFRRRAIRHSDRKSRHGAT
jgi:hypothetical protein